MDCRNNYKKVNFVRYADDFIITAMDEKTATEIKLLMKVFLEIRGQKGICPVCNRSMDIEEERDLIHIIPIKNGGK